MNEFLKWIEPTQSENGDAGVESLLSENLSKVESLTERYKAVSGLPTELLKEYLKERKKLAKM